MFYKEYTAYTEKKQSKNPAIRRQLEWILFYSRPRNFGRQSVSSGTKVRISSSATMER